MNSEELGINLFEIVFLLVNKVWIIILTLLIFVSGAYVYTNVSYSPKYLATTSFVVNAKQNGTSSRPTAADIALAQQLVDTYTLVLRSNTVMSAVTERLHLDINPAQLGSCISLSSSKNTQVLYLNVSYHDKKTAVDIAKVITEIAPEIMMKTVEIGSINVLDTAHLNGILPKKTLLNCITWGLIGLIISALIIVIHGKMFPKIICPQNVELKLSQPSIFELEHIARKNKGIRNSLLLSSCFSDKFTDIYMMMGKIVKHTLDSKKVKKLLVTSPSEGEGKTTISVNIALALARRRNSVLLIDCNLKSHRLEKVFKITNANAELFDFDHYQSSLENCIEEVYPGLFVIPYINKIDNIISFQTENFKQTINRFALKYDYIIFDSGPVIDALNLVDLSDGVLLILKQNQTSINHALKAIENLHILGGSIIGCILNDVKHGKLSRMDRYYPKESTYSAFDSGKVIVNNFD